MYVQKNCCVLRTDVDYFPQRTHCNAVRIRGKYELVQTIIFVLMGYLNSNMITDI